MNNIIIVGAGLAGLTAAIKASDCGSKVCLISPDFSERSQSARAMGGINAALNTKGEEDSIKQHFNDTMKSGCEINNSKAVKNLTTNAPKIVRWLETLGVSFSRDENNNIDLRYFGGQKSSEQHMLEQEPANKLSLLLLMNAEKKKQKEVLIDLFLGDF